MREIVRATGLPVELDLTVRQLLVNDPELSERICRALEEAGKIKNLTGKEDIFSYS